jgi:predicted transcriptional regulator
MDKDKLFSVRMDASLLKKLQEIAKREDRSVNYIINRACEKYAEKDGK